MGRGLTQVRSALGSVVAVTLLVTGLASCDDDGPSAARTSSTSTSSTTTTSTTTTTTTTLPPTTVPPPPVFASTIAPVTTAELGASWHEGCPVGPENLRMLTVSFIGFDGGNHTGQIVVHADSAEQVVEAFRRLHAARFPIRKLKPIFTQFEYEDFDTVDDNSSGFSCRNAVDANAAPHWSNHAYGRAIDINPIENPYLNGGKVLPPLGAAFTDRGDVRPGMAVEGGALVDAFRSVGWDWGASFLDYQHFSTTGH